MTPCLRTCFALAAFVLTLRAAPEPLVLTSTSANSQTLNGAWHFKYFPVATLAPGAAEAAFNTPAFDDSTWAQLAVPSHWELAGFAEPHYGKTLAEGTGLYRRSFRVPASWTGQHIFLRFDGVLFGFEVWVNGTRIGEWASGYNPVTFDVTSALRSGTDNVIAVRVTTRSKGWEFDTNDCWSLSGIYRDVTLFAVPAAHLQDYSARTALNADGSATVSISAITSGAAATVSGRLLAPDGKWVRSFQIAPAVATAIAVEHPQLWTAETPSLYTLELSLASGQTVTEKIGLRQISIVDGVLQLNGRPVKLRGVDHHDLWPDVGRATNETLIRRDLELIKAANINFIRTSHYPPHRRMLELCDELGLYVMCEVPFGFGDEHLTDPAYQDVLLTRAEATVARDKNRACILIWSVGNENPNTPLTFATARRVKALDPSRPVCFPQVGSYFGRNFGDLPPDIDVYAPHYPVLSTVRDYAQRMTRPVIFTEYAHALGLATDRIQDEWAVMQASPRIAGGAVWMFQDQGILRKENARPASEKTDLYVWPDAHHYYDTDGNQGMDGIVYSDRTPQPDYWQVRKVYSPVQIPERRIDVPAGAKTITFHVENRFDFRSLAGVTLQWELQRSGKSAQSGKISLKADSHAAEEIILPLKLPIDAALPPTEIFTLTLRCAEEKTPSFYEHTIKLEVPRTSPTAKSGAPPVLDEQPAYVRITYTHGEVRINRANGELTLTNNNGPVLTGFFPHIGRRFTEAESLRSKKDGLWAGAYLRAATQVAVETLPGANHSLTVTVRGHYARPEAPEQTLEGSYTLFFNSASEGRLDISYDYKFVQGKGPLLEAGLSMLVPADATSFRFLGAGPYAGYPGKDALNEYGFYHLHRDDLNFQGNRREVDAALLARPDGSGIALFGRASDIAVERVSDGTVFSHNALLSGRGNKGSGPETNVKAEDVTSVSGHFSLLPLEKKWPESITRWFGHPGDKVAVLNPYFRSYDQ